MMKKIFHSLTLSRFEFRNNSYSQEGEDLFLWKYFGGKKKGFFVDVGAHHPKRLSNTYLFYKRGWRGINIDARPGSMKSFTKVRPNDINIEAGVDSQKRVLTYYSFNEPALNTFSREEALKKSKVDRYKIIEELAIPVRRLESILKENIPEGQTIDFLTVDVEGKDLEVLKSNDWNRFRPKIVLVEDLPRENLLNLNNSEVVKFMSQKDYFPIGRSYSTMYFEKVDK